MNIDIELFENYYNSDGEDVIRDDDKQVIVIDDGDKGEGEEKDDASKEEEDEEVVVEGRKVMTTKLVWVRVLIFKVRVNMSEI